MSNPPGSGGPGSKLNAEQITEAKKLWEEGKNLRSIAEKIGCGVYDLSPWLWVGNIRTKEGGKK